MQLFHLEGDDPYDKFLPKISSVVSKIIFVYMILTLYYFILYYLNGMTLFDAIAHSFTTISTGGFSTHNDSFAYFQSNINFKYCYYFYDYWKYSFFTFSPNVLFQIIHQ